MISKYENNQIALIWSDENKFALMSSISKEYIELLSACENLNLNCELSSSVSLKEIKKREQITKHETVAFLHEFESKMISEKAKRFLHKNLTSSDLLDSTATIMHKQSSSTLIHLFNTFTNTVLSIIDSNKDVYCIGRTHSKRAELIKFNNRFKLLLNTATELFESLQHAINSLPQKLSGPMGDSSGIPTSLQNNFAYINKTNLSSHNMQIIPRFYYAQIVFRIANLATCFEKFFTDLRILALDEVNEIQEGFSKGQAGSSAMPHKKNPILSERICGLSRILRSYVSMSLENNISWFERDISHSSTERLYWPDMWHIICYILKTANNILKNISINYQSIETNSGFAKTSRDKLNINREIYPYSKAHEQASK
tara:strand:+ start:428 stop:1540 length:1113 start_codon:yes stop_codon:yes gene_type:complete